MAGIEKRQKPGNEDNVNIVDLLDKGINNLLMPDYLILAAGFTLLISSAFPDRRKNNAISLIAVLIY